MPCIDCDRLFKYRPCEKDKQNRSPRMVLDKVFEECTEALKTRVSNRFYSLVIGCPCKECIIKIMCRKVCILYEDASSIFNPFYTTKGQQD